MIEIIQDNMEQEDTGGKDIGREDSGQELVHAGRDNIFAYLKPQLIRINTLPTLPVRKISALLNTIIHGLPGQAAPVIHFISAYKSEGAGKVAFDTAVSGAQSGKRVLLIDASPDQKSFRKQLRKQVIPPLDAFNGSGAGQSPFLMVEGTTLFFAALGEAGPDGAEGLLRDGQELKAMLDQLRETFSLIVIESEGALRNPAIGSVAGVVDANVIVVQAERTRLPVVRELKRLLEANGGRVIGSVMNNRRYYIPRLLYPILFRG